MEGNNLPMAPAAPAAPPAGGAAMPMAPAPMPPAPAAPAMADGGETSGGGLKNFFGDINLLEWAVVSFTLGYILWHAYKTKTNLVMQQAGYSDLNGRVTKLESAETARKAEANAVGKMRRPVLRLG